MLPRYFFIAILVFTLIITGYASITSDMTQNYPSLDRSGRYFASLDGITVQTNETTQSIIGMQGTLQTGDTSNDQDIEGGLIRNSLSVLKQIPYTTNIVKNVMYDFADMIGINPVFVTVGYAIIIVIILFSIISYVRGNKQ